ncbi:MAG: glycosyltransferase [bacterium]|nr:glycosyltransferase [bacterium]
MKKKLLYISQVFPYPTDGGGKIKTYNTLRVLAKEYAISAVFVSEKNPSTSEIAHLKKFGVKKVRVFFNTTILDSVKDNLWHLIKNFLQLRPHYVFQYTHTTAAKFIQSEIKSFSPDVIHIDHANMAQYLPKEKKQVWILESHNLEFYLLWTRFVHSSKLSRKAYLLIEATLTYLFEYRIVKLFDCIFAISNDEKFRMQHFFSPRRIESQPLFYQLAKRKSQVMGDNQNLLFIGNLRWPPNEHAIEWFITNIWPLIRAKNKRVRLHIVGQRYDILDQRLSLLDLTNISFFGFQKSLDKYLRAATAFILPFKMGGGVRLKSLTALASSIPIVSTSLGVEGLTVRKEFEYLEANTEGEFAEKILLLLENKKMRDAMAKNQEMYMKKNHSATQNKLLLKKYQEVIQESQ